jgi:hypothetical protein
MRAWEGELEVPDVLPVGFGGDAVVGGYGGQMRLRYWEEVWWWEFVILLEVRNY